MSYKLYLDDIRQPYEGYELVRNYGQFIEMIAHKGLPEIISFDHDLADIHYNPNTQQESFTYQEKTGYDCAKWLVDYCLNSNLKLPKYNVHSMNPVGKENIIKLLQNYENTYR